MALEVLSRAPLFVCLLLEMGYFSLRQNKSETRSPITNGINNLYMKHRHNRWRLWNIQLAWSLLPLPPSLAAVRSKAVVPLLFIYCSMYFPLFVRSLCLSSICFALNCVHSSFAIILKRKRKLIALLLLSYRCLVTVSVPGLTVPWVILLCVFLVFPDHTHLLFVVGCS